MAQRWHRQKPLGRACSSARGLWPTQRPRAEPDSQPVLSRRRPPPPHADDVAAPNGRAADDATAALLAAAADSLDGPSRAELDVLRALAAGSSSPADSVDAAARDVPHFARASPPAPSAFQR